MPDQRTEQDTLILDQHIGVRILGGQPMKIKYLHLNSSPKNRQT